jgi:hypothetical protein
VFADKPQTKKKIKSNSKNQNHPIKNKLKKAKIRMTDVAKRTK